MSYHDMQKIAKAKGAYVMAKMFLFGYHWDNNGPSDVNKAIIKYSDEKLTYLTKNDKFHKLIEIINHAYLSDAIIISGVCSRLVFEILMAFQKKMVYLMHGDIEFENAVNKLGLSSETLNMQRKILNKCDLILCVSESYSKWVKQKYPQYEYKISFLNNGVVLNRRNPAKKEKLTIAVAGGNRPIKNNADVCRAVEILANKGVNCKLYVFGRMYPNCDPLPVNTDITYVGHLNGEEYYSALDIIDVFVMNSDVESFGLTVADALNSRCSLLMSKNTGALSIMQCKNCDIIENNHDPVEIADKIIYLSINPNSDRLFRSIDVSDVSPKSSYERLAQICEELCAKNVERDRTYE